MTENVTLVSPPPLTVKDISFDSSCHPAGGVSFTFPGIPLSELFITRTEISVSSSKLFSDGSAASSIAFVSDMLIGSRFVTAPSSPTNSRKYLLSSEEILPSKVTAVSAVLPAFTVILSVCELSLPPLVTSRTAPLCVLSEVLIS